MNGKVKFFDNTKGFGFIIGEDGKEYFVHISGLNEGAVINDDDEVTFDVEQGDRGPKAVNVKKAEEGSEEEPQEEASEEESSEEESSEEESSEEESQEEASEEEPKEE